MEMRFLFRALTLVFMVALGEAVGDRMRWTRKELVEIAGYGELKLSSVILTASLLSSSSDPISGATVGIMCHTGHRRRSEVIKAVTNEFGQFTIDLPSDLHAITNLDKACSIKPLSVPKPHRCSHKIYRGIKLVSSSNVLERDLASLHKAHRITGFGPRTPESGPKISPVNWSIGEKTDLNGLVLRSIDLLVSVGSTNHRSAPSPSNAKIGPGPLRQTTLRANKRHTHEGYKKTTEEQEKGSENRHQDTDGKI